MNLNKDRRCSFYRRETAGFNLLEITLVLLIASLILTAIWGVASQLHLNDQVRTTAQQLAAIDHNIRGIYVEQGGMINSASTFTLTKSLDQLNVFPVEMRANSAVPTGTLYNVWSQQPPPGCGGAKGCGTVVVDNDDCTGVESWIIPVPCFGVTYINVPLNACVKLMAQTAQGDMGLQKIIINAPNAGLTPPISVAQAQASCNSPLNTILWVYLLKGG